MFPSKHGYNYLRCVLPIDDDDQTTEQIISGAGTAYPSGEHECIPGF